MRYTNPDVDQAVQDAKQQFAQRRAELDMMAKQGEREWHPIQQQQTNGGAYDAPGRNLNPEPKRQPEIPIAATELNQLAVTLMNVLVDLEKRLDPVMRSVPPTNPAADNTDHDYGSRTQLCSLIVQATTTIDLALNRIRGLMDRLEI